MRIQLKWRRSLFVAAALSVATILSCFKDGDESSSAPEPNVLLSGAPEGEVNIVTLAIDPATPSTLYATRFGGGVYKSTDGGTNWSPSGLSGFTIWCLAIDPQTPGHIHAAAGEEVFKSTDGGTTWTSVQLPGVNWINALVIDPLTPTTLYVGGGGGVYKSTDGGATWSVMGLIAVTGLAIDPVTPSTIYASMAAFGDPGSWWAYSEGGVAKSTDAGASWGPTGLSYLSGYYYYGLGLVIDPQTPTTLYSTGIFFEWITWTPTADGVLKTTDGGEGWSGPTLDDQDVYGLAVDPQTPTTVYAWGSLTEGGALKSTDAGATWNAANTGLTDTLQAYGVSPNIAFLAIDPLNPDTLYAGTGIGVFKSTDGGATWEPTGLFQQSPLATVSVDPSYVVGGNSSTGTVTLVTPAPEGGAVVDLSSSNSAAATVLATVTVSAGATSANFTVSTSVVASRTSSTISATLGGVTRSAILTVAAPPDTDPPSTTITSAADGNGASVLNNGTTVSNSVTLAFAGADNVAVAGFECRLDGASFVPCTSPATYSGLALGQHVFEVRAVDASGNLDGSPALFTWTVDAPPETAITSAVGRQNRSISNGGTTSSNEITFTFTGSDNGSVSGFECSLDGAAFATRTSPAKYQSVQKGQHTFRVRAVDNNGHRDPTPATFTWTRN